ncbi:hypothetical protein QJQ45_028717 [Haematococcus lacustris]|nr:hypothetical protein QJQ45_028717 [Haematococcus lacustris]
MGSSAMELEHETQSLLGQVVDATVISSLRRSAAQSLDMHLWAAASSAKRTDACGLEQASMWLRSCFTLRLPGLRGNRINSVSTASGQCGTSNTAAASVPCCDSLVTGRASCRYRANQAAGSTMSGLAYSTAKWVTCFVIGVTIALAAFAVHLSVENTAGFKHWATLKLMEKGWTGAALLLYATMNALLVMVAVCVTLFVAPAAAGSGIAECKAYLNGIDIPGIFYLNTLVAKLVGTIGAVAGGLAVGKEGPLVHAGACIATLISQGGPQGCQLPWFRHFWNDQDRGEMVVTGAAAGVAAAFRSPVGGVLFALEEMSSWWRNALMWRVFFTTAVVSVTVRMLIKASCSSDGQCGFFGSGGFIIFEVKQGQEEYQVYELVPMLLLGVIGGLSGSAFISLTSRLASWRRRHLTPWGVRGRLAEALLLSLLTSSASFMLPLAFSCQVCPDQPGIVCPQTSPFATSPSSPMPKPSSLPLPSTPPGPAPVTNPASHAGNFITFGCPGPNQYSDLATLFLNTQARACLPPPCPPPPPHAPAAVLQILILLLAVSDDAIRNLFSSQTKREYTVTALVTFVSVFFVLAVLTYGVACPTGFFVPSILCGAAYGRLVGIFVADLQPLQHVDEGTYALLGAASFLGGSMRITMCTCVLLLELTNNLALLPLIMLVLLVAKVGGGPRAPNPYPPPRLPGLTQAVGDGTGVAPLYNEQMRLKGLPFLAPSPSPVLRHISAKECCGRPPVAFNQVEQVRHKPVLGNTFHSVRVGHLVAVLKACHHNGFPVMHTAADGNSAILGVLLRQHLLLLLSTGRAFQSTPGAGEASSRVASSYSITDFHKPVSSPGLSIQDITLSTEQLALYLDLGPYVNHSVHVVQEDASLSKCYTLFRSLGLRHLCVVPRAHAVVGMLCREDLLPDTIERRLEAGGGSYAPDGSLSFGMSPRSYQHSPAALGQSRPGTPGHPARSTSPAAMLPSRLRPPAAHGPSHLAPDLESSGDAAAQDAGMPQGSSYANGPSGMAGRAALGRALVASGGTLLVLGGATIAVSSVSMAVTRFVVDRNKKKYMVACPVCHAKQKVSCDVCRGERTLRYQPAKAPQPTNTFGPQLSACAMCEGCGEQTCPNCTGSGETLPLPAGCYLGRV